MENMYCSGINCDKKDTCVRYIDGQKIHMCDTLDNSWCDCSKYKELYREKHK